jgi:hypothetical protein
MLLSAYRQGADDGARALGITPRYVEFQKQDELPGLFADMEKARDHAVFVWSNPFTVAHRAQILDLAIKYRLPMLGELNVFSDALITYGPKIDDVFRQAATYVGLILKGAKPGDLLIGQPTTFRPLYQPQDREGARADHPSVALGTGRRGHSVGVRPVCDQIVTDSGSFLITQAPSGAQRRQLGHTLEHPSARREHEPNWSHSLL